MKTREQLQEEYEDALFALLMYDVAELEGRHAAEENERLLHDPNARVPEDLDRKCLQLINRHFLRKKILRIIKWSIILAAVLLLAGGAIISVYIFK